MGEFAPQEVTVLHQTWIRFGAAFDGSRFASAGSVGHPVLGNPVRAWLLRSCFALSARELWRSGYSATWPDYTITNGSVADFGVMAVPEDVNVFDETQAKWNSELTKTGVLGCRTTYFWYMPASNNVRIAAPITITNLLSTAHQQGGCDDCENAASETTVNNAPGGGLDITLNTGSAGNSFALGSLGKMWLYEAAPRQGIGDPSLMKFALPGSVPGTVTKDGARVARIDSPKNITVNTTNGPTDYEIAVYDGVVSEATKLGVTRLWEQTPGQLKIQQSGNAVPTWTKEFKSVNEDGHAGVELTETGRRDIKTEWTDGGYLMQAAYLKSGDRLDYRSVNTFADINGWRLISTATGDAANPKVTTREYTPNGQLRLEVSPEGAVPGSHLWILELSQLNAANQRTKRTDADNSYWDYAYDSLGQVTNAVRRWADGTLVTGQQYGYQFDTIGNRKTSGIGFQPVQSEYTANLLNQYTQRTVPGFVNLLGSAASNATVTVNGATATRQGEYFHSELALANTNAAAYSPIAITANMTSGTNNLAVTNTGHAFLPKTPEQFTHDQDGNLISDGRWQYTWDAENRLTGIETLPNLPTNVPVQKLLFQYDAQSRRISKVVSNFNGSAWSETSNLRFVYDGWNLLAEVDKTNAVVRSYSWGLDLSGSTTGAGGIGGLLFGTFNGTSSTSSVAYAFDGNGNVSALLDMRTGQLAAEYEYSPFGETIRSTGPLAKENPFRFSTKRTDDTTGLVLYEYRVYQPSTGRWLSRDPLEEGGGKNLLAVQNNDYCNSWDFLGLVMVPPEQISGTLVATDLDSVIKWLKYKVVEDPQSTKSTGYYDKNKIELGTKGLTAVQKQGVLLHEVIAMFYAQAGYPETSPWAKQWAEGRNEVFDNLGLSAYASGTQNLALMMELAEVAKGGECSCDYAKERCKWRHFSKKKDKKVWLEDKIVTFRDFICNCEAGQNEGKSFAFHDKATRSSWGDQQILLVAFKIDCSKRRVSGDTGIWLYD